MLVLNICCYSQITFISNIHENQESFRILIPFLLFMNNLSQNITILCPICQWSIYSDILNNSSSGFHFVKLKWACLSRMYLHLTILAFDTNHKHQSILNCPRAINRHEALLEVVIIFGKETTSKSNLCIY